MDEGKNFMPKYELMYLLAGHITDDEQPRVSSEIKQIAEGFGATALEEEFLGKKKLAYPIGKTKNGFYVVLTFDLAANRLFAFDSKLRTMKTTVVRYLIVKLDEHLKRLAKDKAVQAAMPARSITGDEEPAQEKTIETTAEQAPKKESKVAEETKAPRDLDAEIEAALSESIS